MSLCARKCNRQKIIYVLKYLSHAFHKKDWSFHHLAYLPLQRFYTGVLFKTVSIERFTIASTPDMSKTWNGEQLIRESNYQEFIKLIQNTLHH